jgi:hypothetical protein
MSKRWSASAARHSDPHCLGRSAAVGTALRPVRALRGRLAASAPRIRKLVSRWEARPPQSASSSQHAFEPVDPPLVASVLFGNAAYAASRLTRAGSGMPARAAAGRVGQQVPCTSEWASQHALPSSGTDPRLPRDGRSDLRPRALDRLPPSGVSARAAHEQRLMSRDAGSPSAGAVTEDRGEPRREDCPPPLPTCATEAGAHPAR